MRRHYLQRVSCICILFGAALVQISGAAELEELMSRIPDSANSIIALNVGAIFDSPLAQKEGWREDYASRYAAASITTQRRRAPSNGRTRSGRITQAANGGG